MFEKEAAARNAAAAASGQVRLNCKDNTSNLGAPLLAGATDGQSENMPYGCGPLSWEARTLLHLPALFD